MAGESPIRGRILLFLILLSDSFGNVELFSNNRNIINSEEYDLILNCVKGIVELENLKNVLIVGRPEHFVQLDVTVIGKLTTIKVYKRIKGWKGFRAIVQYKQMSYILLFNGYYEMEEYLIHFQIFELFNSRLRFVILPLYHIPQTELKIIGHLLIKYRILNYFILSLNSNKSSVNLITNFPYLNKMCGNYSVRNDKIIATFNEKSGFRYIPLRNVSNYFKRGRLQSKLFPSKIPRNLDKCELKIVTGLWPPNIIDIHRKRYPGIEIEFVRTMAKYMNFVPKYVYVNAIVGDRLPNRTWTGFMGYLQRNEVDMAIGAVHIEANRMFVFDVSSWYLYNFMMWIVPRMNPRQKSAVFTHFLVESSLLGKVFFISVFLATAIAMLLAAKVIKTSDSRHYGQIGYISTTLVRLFLGQPQETTPRTVHVSRIFGSWLGFCTFIIFFFQTSITSYFTTPGKAIQLTTVQQAFKMNLRISYDDYYDPFVKDASPDFEVTKMNEKLPVIPSLNLVAKGKGVTFIDRLRAIYISKQWLREDGSIPIRLLYNNPVHRYWVQVVMTRGHFLSPWVNDMVEKSWDNGFWTFKENEYIDRRTTQYSVRRQVILFNDFRGLDNTEAVDRYNDAIYEAFPKIAANEQVNQIFEPTAASERDLLEMFRITTDSKINFSHLLPIFQLYLIGMFSGILAFAFEITQPPLRKYIHKKWKRTKAIG